MFCIVPGVCAWRRGGRKAGHSGGVKKQKQTKHRQERGDMPGRKKLLVIAVDTQKEASSPPQKRPMSIDDSHCGKDSSE